jgi:predicted Zn-dependent peptidase
VSSVTTPTFQRSVTSQGLRVLTESHPGSRGVSAHLWVEVGTRDESIAHVGLSHLIEHMVFKGTENLSVLEIAKSLESVGGDLNAYTSREFTCYHTLSLKKDLELSLKVLGELTTKPLFRSDDLEKEKQVILQEMDMTKDLLEEAIFDDFFTWVYPKNPAGWPIFGTPESVSGITESTLRDFFTKWYHAGNMILTVVGDVDHLEVLKLAEKHFASVVPSGLRAQRVTPTYSDFKVFCPRPSEQTHFIIGRPASSYRDDFSLCGEYAFGRRYDIAALSAHSGGAGARLHYWQHSSFL